MLKNAKPGRITRRTLPAAVLAALLCLALCAPAQSPSENEIRQLAAAQQWQQIVDRLQSVPSRSAQQDYDYGTALAHLGRWQQAAQALQSGRRLAPRDKRFPIELAGIAFRQKHYPQAASLLRQALKLAPRDAYANDFLATVYYLEGNTLAALQYWNRVGKPVIAQVRTEPVPRVSPALLDHAFAFAPASTMLLSQYQDSEVRIRGLGVFPQRQFDLRARPDGRFDVVLRARERNGFGNSKLEAAVLLLYGLPAQSITPSYTNFRRQAINFRSLFRWDPQKRRIFAQLSAPFQHSAKYRISVATDLRNENWILRNSFTGPAPALASLNLRRELISFDLTSYAGARIGWSAGAELSHRDYRNVVPGVLLTPQLLAEGFQLKQQVALRAIVLQAPERRFTLNAAASSQAAHIWSVPGQTYDKLQGALGWHWLPQAQGDDYEMLQNLRAGRTFGQAPFDELFMLGLGRDNNLPMRAHIGTRDGRKGSAPLGRDYVLASSEIDKNIYKNGLIALKAGPFLDSGTISDPSTGLGSRRWLWDAGAQLKVRAFGAGVALSYGRDLQTGNNAIYLTVLR